MPIYRSITDAKTGITTVTELSEAQASAIGVNQPSNAGKHRGRNQNQDADFRKMGGADGLRGLRAPAHASDDPSTFSARWHLRRRRRMGGGRSESIRLMLRELGRVFSRIVNVLTGGDADTSFSARSWRDDLWTRPVIDALALFFTLGRDRNHCEKAHHRLVAHACAVVSDHVRNR